MAQSILAGVSAGVMRHIQAICIRSLRKALVRLRIWLRSVQSPAVKFVPGSETVTAEDVLLRFCPPGPEPLVKEI